MTKNFTDAELAKFWVQAQKVGRAKARLAWPADLELQRQRYAQEVAVQEYRAMTEIADLDAAWRIE